MLLVGLLSIIGMQSYYIFSPDNHALDMWMSRDQQGYLFYRFENYSQAYQRFENLEAKALSAYSSESFAQAAIIFKEQHTREAYFDWANSMAHLAQYQDAIDGYELALAFDPTWSKANTNLELVTVLAAEIEDVTNFDGGSQGQIGADEIDFDLEGEREKQANQQEALNEEELKKNDLNKLWLRRLNTRSEDFLARKFAYQIQRRALEEQSEGVNDDQ